MANYLVCGNYGASNIGDEAILKGLLFELKKSDPEGNFTVMSGNPEFTQSTYGVESVRLFPTGVRSLLNFSAMQSTLDAYKKADFFVLGGGGLFMDHSTLKAVWIWFLQALVAKLYCKKIMMTGQSVGPLQSKIAKYMTKRAFLWAEEVSVRDKASKELLLSLGIGKEINVTEDLATNLAEIYKELICEKNTNIPEQKVYAVVNLKYLERTNKLYEKAVAEFIKYLINQNSYNVYLKPFGNGEISDEKYLNTLIVQYGLDKNRVHVHTDYSIEGTLKLLRDAKFTLGMRLHFLILSRLTKTPFIGINYHDKVKNYFQNSEDIIEIDSVSCEKLISHSKLTS